MFLNKIFLDEQILEEKSQVEEGKDFELKKSYVGLFAPPMLDNVWTTLISLDIPSGNQNEGSKIYEKFCNDIFGFYLDRPICKENDKEGRIGVEHSIESTSRYLSTFKKELKPILPFWPESSTEDYETEVNSTLWLTPKQIEELVELINSKVEKEVDSVEVQQLVTLTAEIIEEFSKSHSQKISKPKNFSEAKYKPSCKKNKETSVSKIYKIFEVKSSGNQALLKRLTTKYGLDEDTAKSWVIEFSKFLTLRVIETDPEVSSNSFPSSIVEQVWATYNELGTYYRETSEAIFPGRFFFPESALSNLDNTEEVSQRYAKTLEFYQDTFCEEPNSAFWENLNDRFLEDSKDDILDDDCNRRIAVNTYRLVVARSCEKTLDTSNNLELVVFDGVEGQNYLKPNEESTVERKKARKANELYDWRVNFPHFNNVYFKFILKEAGKKYFVNKFQEEHKKAIAFASGGFLFFLDPFNELSLQLAQLPKLPVVKTMSLDDIADFAAKSTEPEDEETI